MKKFLFFIPFTVFLVLVISLGAKLHTPSSVVQSPLLHKPFPEFSLPSLFPDKPALNNTLLQGHVSLVNVFASWCAPCAIEQPVLMELAKHPSLRLYGINWKDKDADAGKWLENHGNPYVFVGADRNGRVAIDLGITGAPETYLIDKNGIIIYHFPGALTDRILKEELLPLIEKNT